MAHYPLVRSPDFKAIPMVNSGIDRTQYTNLRIVNKEFLFKVIDRAEKNRPSLIQQWTEDTFIEQLQKKFNAELLLPMRKNHMIVIHGTIDQNDTALHKKLKRYFEAKILVPDWNGVDKIDDAETTLLLTKAKPPYQQPYKALSIEGALSIMG